jgi:hypothetical protein
MINVMLCQTGSLEDLKRPNFVAETKGYQNASA